MRGRGRRRRIVILYPGGLGWLAGEAAWGFARMLSDALSRLPTGLPLAGGGGVRVEATAEVGGPAVLLVRADSSRVTVRNAPGGVVRVYGYRSRMGNVTLRVDEDGGGRRLVRVTAESARVTVEAPLDAVGVIADSSAVAVDAAGAPIAYLSVRADSSGVKAEVKLARGGGVYARLDSSALTVDAKPEGEGEYWLEVDADSSGARIRFEGEKAYVIEEERLQSSRLTIGETSEAAPVRVKARIRADSSSVKLL